VRREVLVGRHGAFGAVLQVMEWLGEFKTASSADRMRKAWDVEQPIPQRPDWEVFLEGDARVIYRGELWEEAWRA
jgi:hypothetical protein